MDWRRARVVLGVGLVLGALLVALALRPPPRDPRGLEGQVISDFDLPLVTPAGLTTGRDGPLMHRGKPFLLHFWAPSCAPCRTELPLWREIAANDRRVTVLTVAGDDVEDIADYLAKNAPTLPTVHDESGNVYRPMQVFELPHTLVISRTGVVVRDLVGAQDAASLESAIQLATAQP